MVAFEVSYVLAAFGAMGAAIAALWFAFMLSLKQARERELELHREDRDKDKRHMARLDEYSALMKGVQRALGDFHDAQKAQGRQLVALSDTVNVGFKHLSDGVSVLQSQLRKVG